jgi:asparagine synthase (glutamine-hydrolysing)
MCGLAGCYGAKDVDVRAMTRKLAHRGPDGTGVTEARNGTLGHCRLAILDVDGGRQPMRGDESAIVYNGEVYNHAHLRETLLRDQVFNTRTDTETILRLYEPLGPDCARLLDGMFAIAIISDDALFLARDPLGIKPLYYATKRNTLYFGSEIKALKEVGANIREFPPGWWYHSAKGWQEFGRLGDLQGLPPCREPDLDWNRLMDSPFHEEEALHALRLVLSRAVLKRLMSDVPVGVSLSGGLDSSIVCALAHQGLERLDTFSVGVKGSADREAAYAVSRHLGTIHHDLEYTMEDMIRALPEVLYYLESFDPALVRSAIPNFFLARLASQFVKVILTGEGADELYAGYEYLRRFQDPSDLRTELQAITRSLHHTNLQRADRMGMAFGLEARVPFLDLRSIALAWLIPVECKVPTAARPEKDLLRRAFAELIPDFVVRRPKQKFSAGAGSSELITQYANETISDQEFGREMERLRSDWNYVLLDKEALYYYRILRQYYDDADILPNMGASRSI